MLPHDRKVLFEGLTNYQIAEQDSADNPAYYGYTDKDGNWYILKQLTNTDTSVSFRMRRGIAATTTAFTTAWAGRADSSTAYSYYFEVF